MAESGDQRCTVRLDFAGFHVEALESLGMPSWAATYQWDSVTFLEAEATETGVAITIADDAPGKQRVELEGAALPLIQEALKVFQKKG